MSDTRIGSPETVNCARSIESYLNEQRKMRILRPTGQTIIHEKRSGEGEGKRSNARSLCPSVEVEEQKEMGNLRQVGKKKVQMRETETAQFLQRFMR